MLWKTRITRITASLIRFCRMLSEVAKPLPSIFHQRMHGGLAQAAGAAGRISLQYPWAMLLDPPLPAIHCKGCWAEYGNKLNLSFEELDEHHYPGKEMGVNYLCRQRASGAGMTSSGSCEKHDDCVFMSFTNGTLIDEQFADDMLRGQNFVPPFHWRAWKNHRFPQGEGVFGKVKRAMELLHERRLIDRISSCYTSANYESITSEEYYDMLIENGAYFIWYFHYAVGNVCTRTAAQPDSGNWYTAASANTGGRSPSCHRFPE